MEYHPYNMAGDPNFIPVVDFIERIHDIGAFDIHVCNLWVTFRHKSNYYKSTISNDELIDSTTITRLEEKYAEKV